MPGPALLDDRTSLRGRLHRQAAPVAGAVTIVLVALADTAGERVAVGVYGVCVTAMLGVSAVYHSGRLGPVGTRRMKRLDHATILLAIAGTYTAVTALALEGTTRNVLLTVIWLAAALGIGLRMAWLDAPYPVVAAVYLAVGWLLVVDLPAYVDALTGAELAWVALGGALYTAGGVVYAVHRPNPWPGTFGYHEVFHTTVVAGATAHAVAVWLLV